jgi:hypothetical protein
MANIKRGHHTVPRFYLEGFANDVHQLGVARLNSKKRFRLSTGDASVMRDFYNIDSRAAPNAVEDLLSDIEGDAAAVFRKVLVDRSWPLSADERAILATFLALQRTRTPSHRQMVEEIREIATRALKSMGRDDVALPAEFDEMDPKTVHIQSMLDIEEHAPYFFGRRWQLVHFSRKRLLTSDTPVGLLPNPDAPPDAALGVGSAWIILFPMSPTVGLMMAAPECGDQLDDVAHGRTDAILNGSTYLAKIFNETTIDSARDFLFHHPDDGNLVPEQLPPPRPMRLEWSPGPPE